MFAPRRILVDRLLAGGLALLTAGLGAAVYVALTSPVAAPPVEAEPMRPAAAVVKVRRGLTESDLEVLWEGLDPEHAPSRLPGRDLPGSAGKGLRKDGMAFRVRGIIYSTAGSSVAFIEYGKGVQLYRTGEPVGEWRIAAIARGSVTFQQNGKRRVVSITRRLYRGGPDSVIAARPVLPKRVWTIAKAEERTSYRKKDRPGVSTYAAYARKRRRMAPASSERSSVVVPGELVAQVRQDPKTALKDVRFEPLMVKGQMRGIHISKLPSFASAYGLAGGDIVRAVEGQAIDSMDRAFALYNRYRGRTSIRVTVERNGRLRDIVFHAR